ncbi:MAG: cell division protein FtsH [Anaerolineaceae bacterium]|nr:cell division protein FtsH [Anaerolineaceae bacterium]
MGVVVLLLFVLTFGSPGNFQNTNRISLNELAQQVQRGNVEAVTVRGGQDVIVEFRNGTTATYYKERETELFDSLRTFGVSDTEIQRLQFYEQQGDNTSGLLFQLLIAIVPTLIIIWLLWRMMRSVRSGQDQAMSFGRSRARVTRDMERPQVTFSDVAGAEEAKEELAEIVEFLKEPEKFIRLGARIPKGVLMVGPPGTGKTLLARAVAGEAGVPFFSISGSEFVEMFVGVGASRVRDLFERAKSEAPSIVFIDEIDAVGRHRGAGLGGGHDEREQTLNQILVEMDGFEQGTNVIIIAATNRPDILDPALLRPGRFDRKVTMDNPDVAGRQEILKVHAKGKPLAPDADLQAMAKITSGFSGADLENLINEAAILTARRNKKTIGMSELQESMERVVMGPERKTRVISEAEKKSVAYHEAGHAILHHVLDHAHPVHKITIVPRGRAGGYVMSLPENDVFLRSREEFEDFITAAMGGRVAEEIVFNQLTTGASDDLQKATNMARSMVMQLGMSEVLGPRTFGSGQTSVFLGREIGEQRDYSEDVAQQIDSEVKRIVQSNYDRARKILTQYRDKLDELAKILIEQETLDRASFEEIMNGTTAGIGDTAPVVGD